MTPPQQPNKKKRHKRPKSQTRECKARVNVNALVRIAVHDIRPPENPPGRFLCWDQTVPRFHCTVIHLCVFVNPSHHPHTAFHAPL